MKIKKLNEEKGVVLVLALVFLLVATLIGINAISTATYDVCISGNKRISDQAFYVAEAGINEFMGRLRSGATSEITDTTAANKTESTPPWRIILATNTGRALQVASKLGISNYTFSQSLQNNLDFAVEVRHKVNIANNVITKGGPPVYVVRSYGFTQGGGNKVVEVELSKSPIVDPPAALYSERPVNIHGSSSTIEGNDQCGTNHKPGILTTLSNSPTDPISISGNPTINGSPPKQYNSQNLDIRGMVDYLKGDANFSYSYPSNQTLTGVSDQWGTPTSVNTSTPITYNGPMSIVYVNMHGNTLKLSGQSHGAGILLVDGNLELNGGFTWYGVIIAIGTVDYTGGGQNNVTGGILCGETATISVDVGGNAGIIYCSAVANKLKDMVTPLRVTRWREVF